MNLKDELLQGWKAFWLKPRKGGIFIKKVWESLESLGKKLVCEKDLKDIYYELSAAAMCVVESLR